MVTNDLQALSSPIGHGDSFWSIALAHMGLNLFPAHLDEFYKDTKEPEIDTVGNLDNKTF
jgi:hypothetical protein